MTLLDLMDAPQALSLTAQLAAYFKARPHVWIDGVQIENIAGRYAWRTRISNCRTRFGMVIENRQTREGKFTKSEYRYVPSDGERAS